MKKYFVLLLSCMFLAVNAQKTTKIGYIDMDYILEKVPEYAEAKNQLEQKANTWKHEIETKKNDITRLKEALASEKVLLTKELITEKEEEIKVLENEMLDYQQKRFGPNGDLIIQKSSLVKPIQDQVFNIVQDIAAKRNFDFIFDKSSDLTMLYSAERFDISDFVLKELERAGKKVELSKKQQKIQEDKEKREFDTKENPEILEKEKAIEATKEAREKKLQERKDALAAKKKEADEKRAELLKQRAEARQKLLDEQKAKREALKNKAADNKTPENKTPENKNQEPKKD
ncbi:OmpH family outer membrane protein [Flavobacterium urocaniciphilum]|uniref:Periplasmic chaperone for outer membrane proteins Skp n=1 Tax=Flavobacterium urocaniciphilum TaxID=1299341 RepID=A0A1H9CI70_9FLAO|nr:OmpH family outer membrane protein [Flavobacterium urocaniciphilum]SEQ00834.1 periplasmic chaperone for outer membrane proteins Skp [Flavobacterium urocaniciphilum]